MDISVNGITLHYQRSGTGSPLILLHGNGEDHHIFDRLCPCLQGEFSLYAIDSRGHGGSTRDVEISYDLMMRDLDAFIGELSLEDVHLLGFSDGAIISLLYALAFPRRVKSMALLGVNLSPLDFLPEVLSELEEEYSLTGDPLTELMLKQPDISLDSLRALDMPTLFVFGENDLFVPFLSTELSQAVPGSSSVIMKGHSHDSYISGTDVLYTILKDFYRGMESGQPGR